MSINLVRPETGLSKTYFTKEFKDYEIESKWVLKTQNPVPALLKMRSDINEGLWPNFKVAMAMGKLCVGVRFFDLHFQFWGVNNQNGQIEQVAMVACMTESDRYQLAFKSQQYRSLCQWGSANNSPLVRRESRTGKWISYESVLKEIKRLYPHAWMIGEISREKCFTYITNTKTYRNFSISTDLCHNGSRKLSQVEVEYKGRSGCWFPDTEGHEIFSDFSDIHGILVKLYGNILSPTNQTKFEWIMSS